MRKKIIILLILSFSYILEAKSGLQVNINIDAIKVVKEIYSLYQKNDNFNNTNKIKFIENFSNNSNEWTIFNSTKKSMSQHLIFNDNFVIDCDFGKQHLAMDYWSHLNFKKIGFSHYVDFDIEVKLKSMTSNNLHGIIWGNNEAYYTASIVTGIDGDENANGVAYGVFKKDRVPIAIVAKHKTINVDGFSKNNLNNGWNTLRVSRRGTKLFILLNNKKILETSFINFKGSNAGIVLIPRDMKKHISVFDDFTLSIEEN